MRRSRMFRDLGLACGAAVQLACVAALASPAGAQGVLLHVRPHVGDTLITHLEQQTEVSGVMRGASSATPRTVTTSVKLDSRTIVQSSLAASTVVLTIVALIFVDLLFTGVFYFLGW